MLSMNAILNISLITHVCYWYISISQKSVCFIELLDISFSSLSVLHCHFVMMDTRFVFDWY